MKYLSLVICTHNRADLISKLIDHFDNKVCIPDNISIEILIVDNHSADSTKKVIEKRIPCKRQYNLRYIYEEKIGLSNARNRGVEESRNRFIGFIDDDALPEKNYAISVATAIENNPLVKCFAHKVITKQINLPAWYRLNGKYKMINRGNYDLGSISRFLNKSDPLPIGSGMIISKEIFQKYGNFDPAFGYDVSKTMLIPGEETELFLKMIQDEVPIYYIHNAMVNHYPEEKKYEINNICKTYKGIGYWYGKKDALNSKNRITITCAGFPGSYNKRLLLLIIPYLISRLRINLTVRYFYLFQMNRIIGQFLGYRAFRKATMKYN